MSKSELHCCLARVNKNNKAFGPCLFERDPITSGHWRCQAETHARTADHL